MALPRVFISTDLRLSADEKDDAQSLVHALLYQDKMNIVGIAGTASVFGTQDGLVGDIDRIIDIYGRDHALLEARNSAFKSVAELKAISWQGATDIAPSRGYGSATDSSRAIIAQAREAAADGEKLNVLTWGGETDLAQALHDAPEIARHVRFFNIGRQDPDAYDYIKENFRDDLDMWVDSQSTWKGIYQSPASNRIIPDWHEDNARGHGALGDFFADISQRVFHQTGVKMGDSPTVLRFLSGNQNDPTQESWGGEFVRVSGNYYTDNPSDSLDLNRPGTRGAMTVYEDRAAWLRSFAERFDWIDGGTRPPTPTDPEPPTSGAGDDTITVRVSGDAWEGDPMFRIIVDGEAVGPTTTVTADRDDGEWQVFTFRGDFDVDDDGVGIRFVNDHYEGSSGRDRNLYVSEVKLNGETDGMDHTFYRNSTEYWDF